jgi:anti-sigma factor RsiW
MIGRLLERFRRDLSCDEVMEVLQSHLDGEVDIETARRVARHLHTCSDCDLESETYRRIKLALATTAEPVDPEIMASLHSFSSRLVADGLD